MPNRVEMKVSPLRALTHERNSGTSTKPKVVEMKVSPLRALTHDHLFQFTWFYDVEMKVTS